MLAAAASGVYAQRTSTPKGRLPWFPRPSNKGVVHDFVPMAPLASSTAILAARRLDGLGGPPAAVTQPASAGTTGRPLDARRAQGAVDHSDDAAGAQHQRRQRGLHCR